MTMLQYLNVKKQLNKLRARPKLLNTNNSYD